MATIYPRELRQPLKTCEDAAQYFQRQFAPDAERKLFLKDYFHMGKLNIANRDGLREMFDCHYNNPKYNQGEIKGIYVLANELQNGTAQPYYVGISRTVIRRLRNHVFGTTHNTASLAFAMSRKLHAPQGYKAHRKNCPIFNTHGKAMREKTLSSRFSILEIENDVCLYMAEPYVAAFFQTEFNSWTTH